MAKPTFPDSEFLIGRAAQCRSLAGNFMDKALRDRMLVLASEYEEMARFSDAIRPLQKIKVTELKN